MTRKTAADFEPEVLKLFDKYVHGIIPRREFLKSATKYAVAGLTAEGLLNALSPKFAEAQEVPGNDPRIKAGYVEYPSPNGYGSLRGYLVQPAGAGGKLPTVLVVHENRGLNPHIEDVTRRLALDGFIAFAPDALFPLGGYPGDEDKARELFPKLDQTKTREDFIAAVGWLKARSDSTGRVAVVGFCYGGGIANMLATKIPDLAGAVPFYGGAPPAEEVKNIKCPILVHHGEKDERLVAAWPAYEAALKANNVKYEGFVYPGAQHGFNNDTTPRFDKANADLAWKRTLEFFQKNLK